MKKVILLISLTLITILCSIFGYIMYSNNKEKQLVDKIKEVSIIFGKLPDTLTVTCANDYYLNRSIRQNQFASFLSTSDMSTLKKTIKSIKGLDISGDNNLGIHFRTNRKSTLFTGHKVKITSYIFFRGNIEECYFYSKEMKSDIVSLEPLGNNLYKFIFFESKSWGG